jgi:hypothetical protein
VKHLCDNIKRNLKKAWHPKEDDHLVYSAAFAKDAGKFEEAMVKVAAVDPRR